jgi:hypothetical protein
MGDERWEMGDLAVGGSGGLWVGRCGRGGKGRRARGFDSQQVK